MASSCCTVIVLLLAVGWTFSSGLSDESVAASPRSDSSGAQESVGASGNPDGAAEGDSEDPDDSNICAQRLWQEQSELASRAVMGEVMFGAEAVGVPRPTETREERLARRRHSLRHVEQFPAFDLADPFVGKFAELIDTYLEPFLFGKVTSGGGVTSAAIESIAGNPDVMEWCAHVKVVRGRIFFRWGGLLVHAFSVLRFVQSMKLLENAIERYGLGNLSAEFFLATSDLPIATDGYGGLGGYPVFGMVWHPGAIDVAVPDPQDVDKGYMMQNTPPIPWSQRSARAVFRGASNGYLFRNDTNWRANPRVILHRMSDARPDLIDARITILAHIDPEGDVAGAIQRDGLQLGEYTGRSTLENFRYEIVVDGAGGSSRLCGVMTRDRVMIKQQSVYSQFFHPLLAPYVHYVPTQHSFGDLERQMLWLQGSDAAAQEIAKRAQQIAEKVCSRDGRTLYWALLLVKFSMEAMEDSDSVQPPAEVCSYVLPHAMSVWSPERRWAEGWPPTCADVDKVEQPPCTMFCKSGDLKMKPFVWLSMDALKEFTLDLL